ncbi:MAG: response regulator transcription factor [Pyrinomonadaceae bacterium]
MKVLIVDDNSEMRQLIREYVPVSAADIFEGSDGDQALALYEEHRPDWVLMDQQMERTDGITATREIIAGYPAAQICMVTAFNDEELRAEAYEAGVSGFVVKDNLYELGAILKATN